jgi:hypothetical protein
MTPCPVSHAESRAAASIERKDALLEFSRGVLVCQYMAATIHPLSRISTPGWVDSFAAPSMAETRLIDVLSDQMAGKDSDALWASLVGILVKTPDGREWLRDRAANYADFHAQAAAYGSDEQ